MIPYVPKSVVLNHLTLLIAQLKWMWDYLLYTPFLHHRISPVTLIGRSPVGFSDELRVTRFEDSDDPTDCTVCLCRIGGGDEIRELRCGHLFHRACLDRWIGSGHATCPLCRNRLMAAAAELHREVILLSFSGCGGGGRDRCRWWLR
ncbi:E3 ubiquitin-protein ligase RHA1B-like [Andrographis paniculata]|uniref:E3 ubiquitin-protein ligase RHA1B-like n=1 Tax=Andrographis paniculata TaxID=175694 RepID=UPI0021E8C9D7|nr:E3 ubiquitin-protein ligase RHA1B-like [Andrographis paniculata]